MTIQIQHIYEKPLKDGIHILVDRVWPRGVSKEKANLDHWIKDIAPTAELRKWFNHDPQLYAAFKEKYEKELRENKDQKQALNDLQDIIANRDRKSTRLNSSHVSI